jgi:AraC-like DNA-binding protein
VGPADDVRVWRAADLGGLELLRANVSAFTFRPHSHAEFFIALTDGGLATARFRGEAHTVGRDDVIALNPEEVAAGGPQPDGSWSYRALYPDAAAVREIAADAGHRRDGVPAFGGDVLRDPEVAARLRLFHRLAERPDASPLERQERLAAALALLVGRHAAPRRQPRRPGRESAAVRRSREYLEGHAGDAVTLGELARYAGLSAFHLCRVFHEAVGITPHAYQTQVRVRRAKSLLAAGLPITRVAAEAGFYDQAHLTRHFKRITGVTPGRYVRDARG